ncbi:MAG: hypothetical protein AB1846_02580, partial [Chloroflexota bacterium]
LRKHVLPVASIVTYCLMPTHYHLTLRGHENQTSEISSGVSPILESSKEISEVFSPISRAMKNFLISYTKGINKRYGRVGTLFQGAFKSRAVDSNDYLLNLCVYIHANPVKDGLVRDIADWPYSNYLEWIGERDGKLFDAEFVRDNFGSPAEYKQLVQDYLNSRLMPDDLSRYLQSLED